MTAKLNKITATGLFMLLAGTATAQTPAAEGDLDANIIDTSAAGSDIDVAEGENRTVKNTEDTEKKTAKPIKRGYGIGYEYRMRHRDGMTRPSHDQRPERPEHPYRMDRPERPDRPEKMDRPEHLERPVVPTRPTRPERPERHNQ